MTTDEGAEPTPSGPGDAVFAQGDWSLRFDWGPTGLRNLVGGGVDVVVIVDVLLFTTSIDVALGRGGVVLPYRWSDGDAATFAQRCRAVLAGGCLDEGPTLAPSSLLALNPGTRLVLRSPNGSALALGAADAGVEHVFASCMRNASSVGRAARNAARGRPIGVLAAGERWRGTTGPLRPTVEDLLGAGATLMAAAGGEVGTASPEAWLATASYDAARHDGVCADLILTSGSGRELVSRGQVADVALATTMGISTVVPRLVSGEFVDISGDVS